MTPQLLIAGAGMGGLAAALACTRAGWQARLYERAAVFREVGAGIQLGPNATRVLHQWGLGSALSSVAAFPPRLCVRSARDGRHLAVLRLGESIAQRYGAPYATVHRADLQVLLLEAARAAGVDPRLSSRVAEVSAQDRSVVVGIEGHGTVEGDALIGADGLWSDVRAQVWRDEPPAATGHVAYRGVVAQAQLPGALRTQDVNVWLGPRMHLVAYPVRRGALLNVVVIVQGRARGAADDWDQEGLALELELAMGRLCAHLRDLVRAMPEWRLWSLHDRRPLHRAEEMVRGRVALLGDAAHPMRPYFAQGAGMAIEDAAALATALALPPSGMPDVPLALRGYALNRWRRDARVQELSRRNGRIFHARGMVRWGRDLSLRLLGERLLDQPWLYGSR